jgi:CheY-like chemotaxis protein
MKPSEPKKRKSILVVDDDFAFQLKELLGYQGYNNIFAYENGPEAYDTIEQGRVKYDLLIVDCSLGNNEDSRNGGDFCRHQIEGQDIINLSNKLNPSVPIISFSCYDEKPKGSGRHIVKPIMFDALLEIISSYP